MKPSDEINFNPLIFLQFFIIFMWNKQLNSTIDHHIIKHPILPFAKLMFKTRGGTSILELVDSTQI